VNCHIVQNSLSAYLDRELPGAQMIEVRAHVERCDACAAELESLRSVKSGLGALAVCEPREGLAEDVLRLATAADRAPRVPVGLLLATSAAAVALALVLFNAFFGAPSQPRMAEEGLRFDAASDTAVTSPDFGGHAPIMPVGR
jgi:anti-sigma factor RsiW